MDQRLGVRRLAGLTRRHWIGLAIHLAGAAWFARQAVQALAG